MANYPIYPVKNMRITQGYYGTSSHINHFNASPKEFAIDEGGVDTTNSEWFVAPCDLIVYRVYTKGVNTIFLQSKDKCNLPNGGYDYIKGLVTHPNSFNGYKKGDVVPKGTKMFREGNDGASGSHLHMAFGTGRFTTATGWKQDSKTKAWVLESNSLPFEDIFWIDDSINIINNGGLNWKHVPVVQNTSGTARNEGAKSKDSSVKGTYMVTAKNGLNLRRGAGTSKVKIGVLKYGVKVTCYGYHTGNWLYVASPLGEGYCLKDYLKKV